MNDQPRTFPDVQGRCPACGWTSLFLADGGYITCSRLECPDPCAATDLLDRDPRTTPDNPPTSNDTANNPGTEAHPPLHQWRVELLDVDQWMPAGSLHNDRSKAQVLLAAGNATRPTWAHGEVVRRRLVRQTTTYTVESPEQP